MPSGPLNFSVWCVVDPGLGTHAFLDLLAREPGRNRIEVLRTVTRSTRHGRPVPLAAGVGYTQAKRTVRAAPRWATGVKIVEFGTEPDWPGLRPCQTHQVHHTRGDGCDVCQGRHQP